ncbi:cAMP phosphodiesterase [Synechococcus sp. CCY9202]|uniref:cAMP phosphodiesterase n=1 Tax=Synechococcus sp. CCY9202 TaxID=174698 RepID=UPI002B1FD9CE|nr:cAMP phosphodiesterase [Synechococcus sp. CCY9202]MEA5422303.1 cAMP phosphodiesterase [Synechococcus sp. CCY9202]
MTSLLSRRFSLLVTPLLAAPLLTLPLVLDPLAALAAPATEEEMSLYTRIAAVNVCIARSAGVEFDKAVSIAGETIAQLIQGQHDGAIQQVGSKPLSIEELRRGSINSAVLGASEVCPKDVPPEVMKKVQEALKQSEAAPAPRGAAAPGPTAQ